MAYNKNEGYLNITSSRRSFLIGLGAGAAVLALRETNPVGGQADGVEQAVAPEHLAASEVLLQAVSPTGTAFPSSSLPENIPHAWPHTVYAITNDHEGRTAISGIDGPLVYADHMLRSGEVLGDRLEASSTIFTWKDLYGIGEDGHLITHNIIYDYKNSEGEPRKDIFIQGPLRGQKSFVHRDLSPDGHELLAAGAGSTGMLTVTTNVETSAIDLRYNTSNEPDIKTYQPDQKTSDALVELVTGAKQLVVGKVVIPWGDRHGVDAAQEQNKEQERLDTLQEQLRVLSVPRTLSSADNKAFPDAFPDVSQELFTQRKQTALVMQAASPATGGETELPYFFVVGKDGTVDGAVMPDYTIGDTGVTLNGIRIKRFEDNQKIRVGDKASMTMISAEQGILTGSEAQNGEQAIWSVQLSDTEQGGKDVSIDALRWSLPFDEGEEVKAGPQILPYTVFTDNQQRNQEGILYRSSTSEPIVAVPTSKVQPDGTTQVKMRLSRLRRDDDTSGSLTIDGTVNNQQTGVGETVSVSMPFDKGNIAEDVPVMIGRTLIYDTPIRRDRADGTIYHLEAGTMYITDHATVMWAPQQLDEKLHLSQIHASEIE